MSGGIRVHLPFPCPPSKGYGFFCFRTFIFCLVIAWAKATLSLFILGVWGSAFRGGSQSYSSSRDYSPPPVGVVCFVLSFLDDSR